MGLEVVLRGYLPAQGCAFVWLILSESAKALRNKAQKQFMGAYNILVHA